MPINILNTGLYRFEKKTTALYFMLLNVAQGSGQFSNANENVSIEMENESNWEMQKII